MLQKVLFSVGKVKNSKISTSSYDTDKSSGVSLNLKNNPFGSKNIDKYDIDEPQVMSSISQPDDHISIRVDVPAIKNEYRTSQVVSDDDTMRNSMSPDGTIAQMFRK